MLPPSKTIGIVPIEMDFNNFLFDNELRDFFEDWLLNLKISFLK